MTDVLNQSGRSMTEMLGTLAIMGVLSIGGIVLYSYAMDRYRANRTMHDVNVRGVDVLFQFETTGDATLDAWKDDETVYPITLEEGTIGIQVDGVPERVCDMVVEGLEETASAIKINAELVGDDTGTCGEENSLVFYFDENSFDDEELFGPIREQCGDVLCEQCQKCDTSTQTCVSVVEMAQTVDDFYACTKDGKRGYCLLGTNGFLGEGEGCSELGTCPGEPQCNANVDGTCVPLDSSIYLEYGLGGFRCTKDGEDGYCMAGICDTDFELEPCGETFCSQCSTCNEETQACEPLNFDNITSLDDLYGTCTSNGYKSYCMGDMCLPLGALGCDGDPQCNLIGCDPLDSSFFLSAGLGGFRCTKDGEDGYCMAGICDTDSDFCGNKLCKYDEGCGYCDGTSCHNYENGTSCEKDGYVGICQNGSCVPICSTCTYDEGCGYCDGNTCINYSDDTVCIKDSKHGYCKAGACRIITYTDIDTDSYPSCEGYNYFTTSLICDSEEGPMQCSFMGDEPICYLDAIATCTEGEECPYDRGCAYVDNDGSIIKESVVSDDLTVLTGNHCRQDNGRLGVCSEGKCMGGDDVDELMMGSEPFMCANINCKQTPALLAYTEMLVAAVVGGLSGTKIPTHYVWSPPSDCFTCQEGICGVKESCFIGSEEYISIPSITDDGQVLAGFAKKCQTDADCGNCYICNEDNASFPIGVCISDINC